RQETSVNGQLVVNGFDGLTPWIVNPIVSPRPIILTGPQADQIKEDADFDTPLVDYKARGATLAMNGFEMMGSRRVVHLRLTTSAGQRSDIYLDAETYLDTKLTTQMNQARLDRQLSD